MVRLYLSIVLCVSGISGNQFATKDLDQSVAQYMQKPVAPGLAQAFFTSQSQSSIQNFLTQYPECFYGLCLLQNNDTVARSIFFEWQTIAKDGGGHTQTTLHLQARTIAKPIAFFGVFNYQNYYLKAWLKEKELKDQYYCFYHGQMAQFGFLQEFTKELINELYTVGYLKNCLADDYLFIQNPKNIKKILNKDFDNLELQSLKKEQDDLMSGRIFNKEPHRKAKRFSVNAFLFACTHRGGSCTWSFVCNNSNINYYSLDLEKECFEKLDLKISVIKKYKKQCERLYQDYCSLFTKGRLLQIAIPKKMVDDCVYIASDGAYKDPVYTKSGKKITQVSDFFSYLEQKDDHIFTVHAASNHLRPGKYEVEFAMPLTAKKILDPSQGIKVFAYMPEPLTTHVITYQEYKKQVSKLCKQIAQEVVK